jgi:hypothetical protein
MRYPHYWPDEHPNDPRIFIPNIEFYITNVCNLACPQCNRFNDHDFSGHQIWDKYEEVYTAWSKKVRLQKVTILGGEPLLNPSITDWICGINRLWDKRVNLLTNGTRLNQVPGLYDAMMNYRYAGGNWIGISVHNVNDLDLYFNEVKKFLPGKLDYWEGKDNSHTWGADYAFEDKNRVRVNLYIQDSFYKSAVYKNDSGRFILHQNNPVESHNHCGFVKGQCHHFIRGKLYKCGPVALFPEFDQQHHFDITDEDRSLLNSYQPLTVDEFDTCGQQFIDDIDEVIPQCKFCPSVRTGNQEIQSLNKVKNATSSFNLR